MASTEFVNKGSRQVHAVTQRALIGVDKFDPDVDQLYKYVMESCRATAYRQATGKPWTSEVGDYELQGPDRAYCYSYAFLCIARALKGLEQPLFDGPSLATSLVANAPTRKTDAPKVKQELSRTVQRQRDAVKKAIKDAVVIDDELLACIKTANAPPPSKKAWEPLRGQYVTFKQGEQWRDHKQVRLSTTFRARHVAMFANSSSLCRYLAVVRAMPTQLRGAGNAGRGCHCRATSSHRRHQQHRAILLRALERPPGDAGQRVQRVHDPSDAVRFRPTAPFLPRMHCNIVETSVSSALVQLTT